MSGAAYFAVVVEELDELELELELEASDDEVVEALDDDAVDVELDEEVELEVLVSPPDLLPVDE